MAYTVSSKLELPDNEAPAESILSGAALISSRSGRTSLSSSIRVFVRLTNGSRIIVPVAVGASVAQLHQEALRRATRIGVLGIVETTVLRTTGPDPTIIFGEDSLEDVLDVTEDQTFFLGPLHSSTPCPGLSTQEQSSDTPPIPATPILSSVPSSDTPSVPPSVSNYTSSSNSTAHKKTSRIYVRWITPKDAIEKSRLKYIPIDPNPVKSSLSLSELRRVASDRLYSANLIAEQGLLSSAEAQLYLRDYFLSTRSRDTVTLADLGLKGSREEPLDVFVSWVADVNDATGPPNKVYSAWGFESTERGIATFNTSLSILFKEIETNSISLGNVLEVLWEVTHFPPSLIVFRELYDNRHLESNHFALAVFAQTIRELSLKMIPPWISGSPIRVLEASRQVFAWLHSMRSEVSASSGSDQTLVHQIGLREVGSQAYEVQPGEVRVDVPVVDADSQRSHKQVVVSLNPVHQMDPYAIAIALDGAYSSPWNYYFVFPSDAPILLEHKRVSALHPADFDNLLQMTNQVDAFRMTSPLQLADTPSSAFPVITLSQDGYVSLYESRGNWGCDDGYFTIFNVIGGQTRMPETNPGQFLLQKLEPIISARKKESTWEVDAWADSDALTDASTPEEAIVICVDVSSSMSQPMATSWLNDQVNLSGNALSQSSSTRLASSTSNQLSRLSEVKDVFKNLITRIAAYRLQTHIGLVTFSDPNSVRMNQCLTSVLLNFRDQLDHVYASGNTAMWDGINKGKDMLVAHKALHPTARCRLIVLTDGEDNRSSLAPACVCADLYSNDIVLDAIVIGTNATGNLFRAAKHTGGYAFCPKTRSALYQIFLLETFIDMRMRPDIVKIPIIQFNSSVPKLADMRDIYDFPPCRPHPNQNDYFIALRDADRYLTALSRRSSRGPSVTAPTSRTASIHSRFSASIFSRANTLGSGSFMTGTTMGASGSTRMLLSEVKAMIENQHDFMDVYVSESNMGFWKVVIQGPHASPYENGTFLLCVELGDQFPRKAPTVRFITPILHPNITKHGRICHPIFDREWTATTHVYEVLQQVFGILMSLEARDAVDPLFTLKFWTDPETGRREVQQYVHRFASRTRHQFCQDIIGSTSSAPSVASLTTSNLSRHTASANPGGRARPISVTGTFSPAPSNASTRTAITASTMTNPVSNPPSHRTNPLPPAIPAIQPVGPNVLRRPQSMASTRSATSASSPHPASTAGSRHSRRSSFFARLRSSRS